MSVRGEVFASLAEQIAESLPGNWTVTPFPEDWGRAGAYLNESRNKAILIVASAAMILAILFLWVYRVGFGVQVARAMTQAAFSGSMRITILTLTSSWKPSIEVTLNGLNLNSTPSPILAPLISVPIFPSEAQSIVTAEVGTR